MAQARKKTNAKRTKKRRKKGDYTLNWVGVILLVAMIPAIFKWGALGTLLANSLRLLVGNAFQIIGALLAGLGLWLFVSGRMPKVKRRLWLGGALLAMSVLGLWTSYSVRTPELNIHADYFNAIWRQLQNDFTLWAAASDVGGGLLGAGMFALAARLLGEIGGTVLLGMLALIAVFIMSGTEAHQIFAFSQKVGEKMKAGISGLRQAGTARAEARAAKAKANEASSQVDSGASSATVATEKDLPDPLPTDDFTLHAPEMPQTSATATPAPETRVEDLPFDLDPVEDDAPAVDLSDSNPDNALADYTLPSAELLTTVPAADQSLEVQKIKANRVKLKQTLESFGVDVAVKAATLGPSITQYEIQPAIGVKVSKIVNLSDDLALALAAKDIRIEAPIPGKSLIGIEVPNQTIAMVGYKDVLEHTPKHPNKPLVVPLGKDVNGQVQTFDLTKMPHLLIAGATGSGKSVMINVIITSILMNAKPSDVRMMLIDPKRVELSIYNGIPHLLTPVVTEAKRAPSALNKVLTEMDHRYERFAAANVRNMGEYNAKVAEAKDPNLTKMPYIVVIVDELSDLMMVAGNEVETAIVRLAQMARAAGIHIIIATQRPSVDVITGLIKANIPSRIAFAVSSGVDSRTILDMNGAEKLLGRGDMLYAPIDAAKPVRIQGAYISSDDVEAVARSITDQVAPAYEEEMMPSSVESSDGDSKDSEDELYEDAKAFVIQQKSASTSSLQRRFRIGYNRAARLIDDLQANGIVGPADGSRPRQVFGDANQTEKEA